MNGSITPRGLCIRRRLRARRISYTKARKRMPLKTNRLLSRLRLPGTVLFRAYRPPACRVCPIEALEPQLRLLYCSGKRASVRFSTLQQPRKGRYEKAITQHHGILCRAPRYGCAGAKFFRPVQFIGIEWVIGLQQRFIREQHLRFAIRFEPASLGRNGSHERPGAAREPAYGRQRHWFFGRDPRDCQRYDH